MKICCSTIKSKTNDGTNRLDLPHNFHVWVNPSSDSLGLQITSHIGQIVIFSISLDPFNMWDFKILEVSQFWTNNWNKLINFQTGVESFNIASEIILESPSKYNFETLRIWANSTVSNVTWASASLFIPFCNLWALLIKKNSFIVMSHTPNPWNTRVASWSTIEVDLHPTLLWFPPNNIRCVAHRRIIPRKPINGPNFICY